MALLFNTELKDDLVKEISQANESILILSAFIKKPTIAELLSELKNTSVDITVVSRWRVNDLISGVSDIDVYEFVNAKRGRFLINNNMHFKMYVIDEKNLFIGSANMTQKGMGIAEDRNDESSIKLVPTSLDVARLKMYILSCNEITDSNYLKMRKFICANKKISTANIDWPNEVIESAPYSETHVLWVNDLLFSTPIQYVNKDEEYQTHDCTLLNLNIRENIYDKELLLKQIRKTLVWSWLIVVMNNCESNYSKFGEITAKLHASLIDDPKPYRKTVKSFVSNMFEWIRYLKPEEIGIKKFNYTEALFLVK